MSSPPQPTGTFESWKFKTANDIRLAMADNQDTYGVEDGQPFYQLEESVKKALDAAYHAGAAGMTSDNQRLRGYLEEIQHLATTVIDMNDLGAFKDMEAVKKLADTALAPRPPTR